MIGCLPTSLDIGDVSIEIDTDYRTALLVFEAYNDPDYEDDEKLEIAIECLVLHPEEIKEGCHSQLQGKINWFLDGGEVAEKGNKIAIAPKPVLDWVQDEQLIFAAVNKVAGREVRNDEYMHWWTFLGYFKERGECFLNTLISLRDKLNKRQKLTKDERDFYKNNQSVVDLKKRLSVKEKAENEYYERLLAGKE